MTTEDQNTELSRPEENRAEPEVKTLEITGEITGHLNEAGRWSKFLAILGFVFMGFLILAGFILSIVMAFLPSQGFDAMPFPPFLIGIIYFVMGAVYLLPILYLYRFSTGIKQALFSKNQNQLTQAFFNLKAHYRFIGILMIVFLAIYLLMFVIIIFGGLFAGFSNLLNMQA